MDKFLSSLDREFEMLDSHSRDLLAKLTDEQLFIKPRAVPGSMTMFSCGEYILRSAGMVEKTFGGITTRLWDDPFEWTLPEKLFDRTSVLQYLDEVKATRLKGISFIGSDNDLSREIPAPQNLKPLVDILLETLMQASHFQGRAFAIFQMISDEKLPRL